MTTLTPPQLSPEARLSAVLRRIASATSVVRTRQGDSFRSAVNGSTQDRRMQELVVRLEAVAEQLERAIS